MSPYVESLMARYHEVGFYSDDRGLIDGLTQFVRAALKVDFRGAQLQHVATGVNLLKS